ncbi:MAG: glycosyltransferase family 4 protein [Candidatus Eremiobacteraeota bacterium]|nr:glycosyltransferase family 4 protein [Candidatus Eremiobacteraeota bacterium]
MNVLVVSNRVPFVHGGAEELCVHLVKQLRLHGVAAEAMRIPFSWNPAERLIEEMLIARSLRLYNVDRLIALKFPAYLIPHVNKVYWLLHQYRQAYDLWDAGRSNIPADARGQAIRGAIRQADNIAFAQARRVYTNSRVTANRLHRYNGVASSILAPPLNDPELFTGGEPAGYIFAGGRINADKRQTLLVHALRHAPAATLVIAGPPDTPADAQRLRAEADAQGVTQRIRFDLRFMPREEMAALVNHASAVAYLPFDEDSMGYVTMEAFQAGKPVITTADSGGVLELVKHGVTGYVAEPDPRSLGAALRAVVQSRETAAQMGAAARRRMIADGLNWPSTIAKLLA